MDRLSGLSALPDPARDSPAPSIPGAPRELRQRWRLTFARASGAPAVPHREVADEWLAALLTGELPMVRAEGTRARPPLTFAAPLPIGMPAERELADLFLFERLPAWAVWQAVVAAAPEGIAVTELYDVWLGAPALPASLAAADYRVSIEPGCDPGREALAAAAAELLTARTIPRQREKGRGLVAYDLRPLLADIHVLDDGPARLRVRTLFHPERGTGRLEEAIAALGDALGKPLETSATVRERLILADELADCP